MGKYGDDILALVGCALILIGVWKLFPNLIWFAGGGMCLVFSVMIGLGGSRNDHQ
jgi:hypothetical protein